MPRLRLVCSLVWLALIAGMGRATSACATGDGGAFGGASQDDAVDAGGGSGGNAGNASSSGGSGGNGSSGGASGAGGPIVLGEGGSGGAAIAGDGGPAILTFTIRDFQMYYANGTNPDFENALGDDRGIVASMLGADHKPAYKSATGQTPTTHGKMYFDQWYNDVPGVNIKVSYPVSLSRNPDGTYGYDSRVSGVSLSPTDPTKEFFPIDDGTPYATAFGNQGLAHNYSFTHELHTVFTYAGGESFSFSGDDDVFVFINGALVIDLGGVHTREQATVSLDTLGLTKGRDYPLDFFGAERHTDQSNVSFTTTLNLRPAPVAL